jgi:MFS family permease
MDVPSKQWMAATPKGTRASAANLFVMTADASASSVPAPRGMFAAFRHRSFRLWFAGQTVSLVGTWMQNLAQGWLVYEITGSALLMGTVNVCGSLPMLLFTLWGGVIADRIPKSRILLVTQALLMFLALALAALAAGPWVRFWHVLVLATLGGVVMAFDMPARQSMLIELVGEEDLMNAVALNSSVFNGARIVGPMIAGQLLPVIHASGCFLVNGISFLAVLLSLFRMRHPERVIEVETVSPLRRVAEGFRYVSSRPPIALLFGQLTVLGIFGWSYTVLMPKFAGEILHVGERGFGLLLTANGVGALAASLANASRRKEPSEQQIFLGVLIFAAAQILFAASRSMPLSLAAMVLAGWAMITFFNHANALVQGSTPDDLRGRVMGIYSLTFTGTSPVGALFAGAVSDRFGPPVAVSTAAVLCGASAALCLLLLPRVLSRRDPRHAGIGRRT